MQHIVLHGTITPRVSLRGVLTKPAMVSVPAYEGTYEVSPCAMAQTLFTAGKRMIQNIMVGPIPQNYGLITYNGFELTVS